MSLLIKKILTKLNDIDIKITTGQEIKTNETIDGKRVYKKRINCRCSTEQLYKKNWTWTNEYNFYKF